MYCTKKIENDLYWVGANDRRLSMFEGVYSVPRGVSYNSFLLLDDVNVLFDTVDKAVGGTFFQNLEHTRWQKPRLRGNPAHGARSFGHPHGTAAQIP